MRPGGNRMPSFENDPLGTVNEPRWIVITDTIGNVLGSRQLGPPVDQRKVLELARKLLIPEGYELQPTMDHPYLVARSGTGELVISLEEDPP
jgi:hypothetical protein